MILHTLIITAVTVIIVHILIIVAVVTVIILHILIIVAVVEVVVAVAVTIAISYVRLIQ